MEAFFVAVAVGIAVYVVFLLLVPKASRSQSYQHTKRALERITEEQEQFSGHNPEDDVNVMRSEGPTGFGKILLSLPGGKGFYTLLLRSGMHRQKGKLILIIAAVFLGLCFALAGGLLDFGSVGVVMALIGTVMFCRWYLRRRIEKRNEAFINMFPDAIDMIVRSVRTGHPFNSAMKMIVENMDPPVSTEFKQVVDEVAYGRTLTDALVRMSHRIDEPDVHFFVVILSVQQETGGNLSEVLSNLSGIIRKRKQLRLKIKAMTSEGRITAWILGALPVFVFLAIHLTTPSYLMPLRTELAGNIILGVAAGMVLLAFWIVNRMVKIDI